MKSLQARSLKTKMTVAICILVTCLLVTSAIPAYFYLARQIKEGISAQQLTLISQLATRYDDQIRTVHEQLARFATTVALIHRAHPKEIASYISAEGDTSPFFNGGIVLVSPEGRVLAENRGQLLQKGLNAADLESLATVVATRKPYISKVYAYSSSTPHPMLTFATPVLDSDGGVIAVLLGRGDLLSDRFLGGLAGTRIGATGYVAVFDSRRTLIMHPDKQRIMERFRANINMGVERSLRGFEGTMENVNSRGIAGLASFKRMQTVDWIVSTHLPLAEAYKPLNQARHYFITVLALAVVFSFVVVWLVMGRLIHPILSLTRHVQGIARKGGAGVLVPVLSQDEIGALADAFNGMLGEIEKQKEELRASRELYQLVADFSSDMAFWRTPNGEMSYVSPPCRQITGYTEQEFYDDPELIDRIIHPDDRPRWLALREGPGGIPEGRPLEFRIVAESGSIHWVRCSLRTVRNENGQPIGVRGSFTDITDYTIMSHALREEKEFAENLVNNAVVPIFVIDADHRIIIWNRACEELTGMKAADMVGTHRQWEPFYDHPRPCLADVVIDGGEQDLSSFYKVYAKSAFISEGLEAEGWYEDLGGKRRYIFFDAAPVRTGDGRLAAVVETLQDITKLKQAEEQATRLKDFYLTLFEEFPALIWRAGTDAKCNYFNRGWLELTGRTLEQEVGDGWAEGVHPDDLERCVTTYLEAFGAREAFSMEYRVRRHDGEFCWIIDCGRPFNDLEGNFAGYIGVCFDVTERKRTEDELRKLSRAVDQSASMIVITDLNGTIEYVNRRFTQVTGYSMEETVGQTTQILKSGMVAPEIYADLWSSITSGHEWHGEFCNRKKNGDLFWEFVTISPITNASGEIAHYLAIKEDITERKAVQESLRISEEKFSRAFHTSPDGFAISRKEDGLLIEANDAFFQMMGYERHEVIGRTSTELGIWADPGERVRAIERIERDGGVRNLEVRLRVRSGAVRTVLWASDVMILNGEECLIVVLRDITEQKENERQLLKSKAELTIRHEQLTALFGQVELVKREWEQTLDCIGDLVILTDGEGNIRRCNRAVAELAGLSYETVHGRDWRSLLLTPDMDSRSFTDGGGELFHQPTGRWFFCAVYPFLQKGATDTPGSVVTLHDTTEQKKVTEALEKAYAELKEAHAQMLQREKMASIGQLAAGVAHEINNPIGFVTSNLGTLGKYLERITDYLASAEEAVATLAAPERREELAALRKRLKLDYVLGDLGGLLSESLEGTERVRRIVQDLKSFSRVDEAECKTVDLRECLDSTINIVWNELKYKATLKKDYGDLPPLKCHPQQLNQVFMNLLVNASHAIEQQGEIGVRTWAEQGDALIAISDTGCGIPEEFRGRIFEPFFTTKEVGKGTGLGLSISYDIVKKHGGELTVASEVGAGTTFTIRLPLIPAEGKG